MAQDIPQNNIFFGSRVAEDETENLSSYFVETYQWNQVFNNEVDIIYGPKGSGKSAIYSLLTKREKELFDNCVLIISAENPRGDTVFQELKVNPPTSQQEFQSLWKLYFLVLSAKKLKELEIDNKFSREIYEILEEASLIEYSSSIKSIWAWVRNYINNVREIGIESSIGPDGTQTFFPKIVFSEPNETQKKLGHVSFDYAISLINSALEYEGFKLWLLIDRLDVAFDESIELETNAIKALFRVYVDFLQYDNISLKIFLRSDIWKRITIDGFREATHITRTTDISWNTNSLLNMIISRVTSNQKFLNIIGYTKEEVLSSFELQESIFYKIFPYQIDVGEKKPSTLNWIIGRTRDGEGNAAPRDVIYLLNEARKFEIAKIEKGLKDEDNEGLITRSSIRASLPVISK